MTVGEAEKAICQALEYCHGQSCWDCPKAMVCADVFGCVLIESLIGKLAEKCMEFNDGIGDQL